MFWMGVPTITNEDAAWCYVITNMSNKLLHMEQSERTNLGSQRSN
jgi:hypothetical protein